MAKHKIEPALHALRLRLVKHTQDHMDAVAKVIKRSVGGRALDGYAAVIDAVDAARARMPEPVPTSSTRIPGCVRCSICSRHIRVVGCRPVPKAMPGSSSSTTSSARGLYSRQEGRITRRWPICVT